MEGEASGTKAKPEPKSEVQCQKDNLRMQLIRAEKIQEKVKARLIPVLASIPPEEPAREETASLTQHAMDLRELADTLCSLNNRWDTLIESIEL